MISVAIDGPAGSGKSTISKIIAQKLGFVHLDTGALYRAIAYFIDKNNVDFNNENEVKKCLKFVDLKIEKSGAEQKILLGGKVLSSELRSLNITKIASRIASYRCVREYLLNFQRDFAEKQNVVMDGRDIGTVVLPNASVKIFITASPEVRAGRRLEQMSKSGEKPDYNEILDAIKKRDYEDTHRVIAPLKKADDAAVIDNSNMNLNQTVESVLSIIKERVESI
ncbi:MAG: (d)CMP kinase [Clostridia bacterium]|nr:(d)CMP kinase [Clostridia bacterium]